MPQPDLLDKTFIFANSGHVPGPLKPREVPLERIKSHGFPDHFEKVCTVTVSGKIEPEFAAVTQRLYDIAQKSPVVLHPVKRCIGENDIELFDKVHIVNIHEDEVKISALLGSSSIDHPFGCVNAHNFTFR
jgi:hypothetical protein